MLFSKINKWIRIKITKRCEYHLWPVWQNWTILESSWQQILLQKKPKYLETFWTILKTSTFKCKLLWQFFCHPSEKLVWATLFANIWSHCNCYFPYGNNSSNLLFAFASHSYTVGGQCCKPMFWCNHKKGCNLRLHCDLSPPSHWQKSFMSFTDKEVF